jgi:DNA-binding response OmpR family regulator
MSELAARQRCLIADGQQSGLLLQSDVEAAGFEAVGPFSSSSSALDWLEAHTPDLAVIDPALDEEIGSSLIQALRSRGVPIVVYSDRERQPEAAPELKSVPWFAKASARPDFLAALSYLRTTAAT